MDGSVPGAVDAARSSDGGDDAPDAGPPPRFVRVFHTAKAGERTVVYATDVREGVVGDSVPVNPTSANPRASSGSLGGDSSGQLVTFLSSAAVANQSDLTAVRFGAGGPGEPMAVNDDHGNRNEQHGLLQIQIKPDGSGALYSWGYFNSEGGGGVDQFYFVDLSGAAPANPVALGGMGWYSRSVLSLNGAKYAVSSGVTATIVDVRGPVPSAPVPFSGTLIREGLIHELALSPSGDRVAYLADGEVDEVNELYVADVSGATPGPARKVSGTLAANADAGHGFMFSPDGTKLAFITGVGASAPRWDLYVVDVTGAEPGQAKKVNGQLVTGGSVGSGFFISTPSQFRFSPDSKRIAYVADERVDELHELFVADVSGDVPGMPLRISGSLVSGGDVSSFQFSPDGEGLSFTADAQRDEVLDLFYVDLRAATPSAAQRVNGELIAAGDVANPTFANDPVVGFSRDGRWLAFSADGVVDGRFDVLVSDVSNGVVRDTIPVWQASSTSTVKRLAFSAGGALVWGSSAGAAETVDVWLADVSAVSPGPATQINRTGPANEFRIAP